MTVAVGKPVSEEVMERISDAIDALRRDESLARTKRELERLSGLSHATVARAFVQDRSNQLNELASNKWRLSERFAAVSLDTGRRTVQGARNLDLNEQLNQKNAEISELRQVVEQYAQALYALQLAKSEKHAGVTEIGVNKSRRRRD